MNYIQANQKGFKIERYFTKAERNLLYKITYEHRKSEIINEAGKVIHLQENVEVPSTWSQMATDILAQKYFRKSGVPKICEKVEYNYDFRSYLEKYGNKSEDLTEDQKTSESSIKQVAHRLAGTWTYWGQKYGYFESDTDAQNFYDEISYCIIAQVCVPNSPQWFNTGLNWAYGITGKSQGHYYVEELNNFNKHLPSNKRLKRSEDAYTHPQPHACFIQDVNDDLVNQGGIFDLLTKEAKVFKFGSGVGSNYSKIRAKGEKLSGGGTSSGLMSFLSVFDKAAGSIKSGGTTRRAAKMVCLDIDHPEIMEFIRWKSKEERKVASLVTGSKTCKLILDEIFECVKSNNDVLLEKNIEKAIDLNIPENYIQRTIALAKSNIGKAHIEFEEYDSDFRSEAYSTVDGQNSNNSIRVSDKFINSLHNNGSWNLLNRTDGTVNKSLDSNFIWDEIALSAWQCADPGIQFDDTINSWHTCLNDGRIRSSNPCSEYMFLDETACNLASINLDKFLSDDKKTIDLESYKHVIKLWTIVLEISVLMSQLISEEMALRTYQYRTLGLGFANLGTLFIKLGIPYDSELAREYAAALTSIMTAEAYVTSAEIASIKGPFERFEANKNSMLKVINNHRKVAYSITSSKESSLIMDLNNNSYDSLNILPVEPNAELCPKYLLNQSRESWDLALKLGNEFGYRNAQVTVIAPTGTIGLVMDCQTTGIEPEFSIVKYKKLVGGGYFKMVNEAIFDGLRTLGYSESEISEISKYIDTENTYEGAPHLKTEHYNVLDCANKCGEKGKRFISPIAHIEMLAKVQPFISGSISKTINMPQEATIDDIKDIYEKSWDLGLKCVAIYRDGSKLSQPLTTSRTEKVVKIQTTTSESKSFSLEKNGRRKLENERNSITHKFSIAGHEGYITVGLYPDNTPGEVFVTMSKDGSTMNGIVNAWAVTMSLALQHGVPLKSLVDKFVFTRFEPSGMTNNKYIPISQSIVDYLGRWLAMKFLPRSEYINYVNNDLISNYKSIGDNDNETNVTNQVKLDTIANEIKEKTNEENNMNEFLKLNNEDAPMCHECGSVMVRNGTCYKCLNCGATSGCS